MIKYYTEFVLSDTPHCEGNEFRGVIHLSAPLELEFDFGNRYEIEELLAENFDTTAADIRLVSWSRMH